MLKDLVTNNRSYRRFYQDFPVRMDLLRGLVNLARLSACGGNWQPLKYILSCDPQKNAAIFQHLSWASHYKDWKGPDEGEKPSAHIIILGDTEIRQKFLCDHGIAAQSIMLGAVEKELGGCIHISINREGLRNSLGILPRYEILLALSLGKPKEKVVIETVGDDGDIKYWRDSEMVHHLPKRSLEEIILD